MCELILYFCLCVCFLFKQQYYFDYCSFVIHFEISKCDVPGLLKIALAIQSGFFVVSYKFQNCFCSIFVKRAIRILIGIALNIDWFGQYDHFNTVNSSMNMMFFHLVCVFFHFFHWCFILFSEKILVLWLSLFLSILFFLVLL